MLGGAGPTNNLAFNPANNHQTLNKSTHGMEHSTRHPIALATRSGKLLSSGASSYFAL